MINLIPYNSTSVAANYRAPTREHCLFFQSILQNSYGLFTTTRVEMGADIDGACGQLALENQNLVLKPRGLADDTALPSEDMMPSQGSSSCASPGSPPLDIEDVLAGGGSGAAAKRPVASVLSKRRGHTSGVAVDAIAPVAAVSPATSAAASCCTDGSSCDCEGSATGSAATASSTVSAAPAEKDKAGESESDDELTVGEILAREGIQRRAGPLVSSGVAAAPEPFLTPAEVARLRVREELRSSWDNRERLQLVVFAVAVITLLAILRHSYGF